MYSSVRYAVRRTTFASAARTVIMIVPDEPCRVRVREARTGGAGGGGHAHTLLHAQALTRAAQRASATGHCGTAHAMPPSSLFSQGTEPHGPRGTAAARPKSRDENGPKNSYPVSIFLAKTEKIS